MEFRVLKYFLTVVREENITKAANVLPNASVKPLNLFMGI